jgi:2-polyprenyl-3-methyl-5-hydroxy-6-metoxy-1,4-benzoquinol methylase
MNRLEIEKVLRDVASLYPSGIGYEPEPDIRREAFNIDLALNGREPPGCSICDIGGGMGLFSTGCAALGMRTLLIDEFPDYDGEIEFVVHKKLGVRIETRDVVREGLADIDEQFDVVTTFDSMEHWHHSPKALFRDIRYSLLKPGGRFVLGAPNCVNLRKRITVPFGIGKWTEMSEWYEKPVFRSHVREPDVDDLLYIAKDMSLKDVKIVGRNWSAYISRFGVVRLLAPIVDPPLRLFPRLCANIYLTGSA